MQAYSDPSRESDPHALPDVEVFELTATEAAFMQDDDDPEPAIGGWFWQFCFPGCLPDGPAIGPFDTAGEALADAQDC